MLMHYALVSQRILSGQLECSTCAEVRSASVQMLTGVIQPYALGLLSSLTLAHAKKSIAMPHPYFRFREFCGFIGSVSTPQFRRYLYLCAAGNIVWAMYVANQEAKRLPIIREKLDIHTVVGNRVELEIQTEDENE